MYLTRIILAAFLLVINTSIIADNDKIRSAQQSAENGDVKTAVIELKNILQQDPENSEARFVLGSLYMNYGDVASAEKELRRAQSLGVPIEKVAEPILDAYIAQGKFDEVTNYLSRYQTENKKLQATFHAFDGFVKLSRSQQGLALELFEKAIELDPDNLRATLGLASYYIDQKQEDKAVERLSDYLQKDNENTRVLSLRGELLRKTGKLDDAEKDYNKVIQLNPNYSQATLGLAFIQATRQQPDAVLASLKKLPSQLQKGPVVKYLTGLSWYLKQDFDKAEENLQEVLKFIPDHTQTHLLTGIIYYSRENWQLAEDHLSRANKQIKNNASIVKLLASTYLKLNQPEKAESILKHFQLSGDKPDAQLYTLLGSTYLQMNRNSQAQEMFNKAVETAPDQSDLKTRLAFGMLAGGDTDQAISTLESAVELGEDKIQTDVLLVMSHLKAGHFDKAINISKDMQSRYVQSPIPNNLTGLALMASGKHADADKEFLKALEKDSGFEVAILNRARNAIAAADEKSAVKYLNEVLVVNATNTTALLALAEISRKQGNNDLQTEYLEKVLVVEPGNLVAISQMAETLIRHNEPLKALTMISHVPSNVANNPVILRIKGMAQLGAQQISSAISTFEQLVSLVPDNIEANFQLGRAYLVNNDIQKAKQAFTHASMQDEKFALPVIWLALGDVALKQKDFDEAVKLTSALLDAGHELAPVYDLRAAAYQGKGQSDEVAALLKRAYIKEPTQQRATRLASFYNSLGNPDKAIELLQNWVSGHADDVSTLTMLAMLFQQQGNDREAIKTYEKALSAKTDDAVVMNNLAWLYHQVSDNRATELARKAYEKSRSRPEIIDTYGWILFENGQHAEALPVLQEALLKSPSHPEIGYHVAVALRKVNRAKEAEPILRRIMRNSPASVFAQKASDLLAQ